MRCGQPRRYADPLGQGLGPVSGAEASGAGLGQNMPNIPLKLWLGGVQAPVVYQGRSGCCIGEDQIAFTVPNNAPTGCSVPLAVQIGDQISNNTLIPIASGSRSCTLTTTAFSSLGAQQIEQLVTAGPVTSGSIRLSHYSDGGGTFEDDARFQFIRITSLLPGSKPFLASSIDDQPPGTCIVYNNLDASFNNPITGGSLLDAGKAFIVTGPKGAVTLPLNSGKGSPFNMTGAFLAPGTYTITGPGGADVGPFTGTVTIPAASTLTSPANNGSATRANGMILTWIGGSGNLRIDVNSCTGQSCTNGVSAVCLVPASLGTFTIPPYIMQALPPGNFAGVLLSSYSSDAFSSKGLNAGTLTTYSNLSGFGYGWASGGFSLK